MLEIKKMNPDGSRLSVATGPTMSSWVKPGDTFAGHSPSGATRAKNETLALACIQRGDSVEEVSERFGVDLKIDKEQP